LHSHTETTLRRTLA